MPIHFLPRKFLPRNGSTLILMTVSLTVIFGLIGFVTDIGMAYFEDESVQAAADAAALAGVSYAASNGGGYTAVYGSGGPCGMNGVLCQGTTSCSAVTGTSSFASACKYAAANGFTDGTNNHTVTISANTGTVPGVSGTLTANYWVQATVTAQIPQLFSAVFRNSTMTVSAKSTATPVIANANVNILVLGSGPKTVRSAGTFAFHNVDNIWVNSSDTAAVQLANTVSITSSVGKMHVVGGITGGATISPAPVTDGALSDPFASVPNPVLGACTTNGDLTVTSGTSSQQPGLFCGNVSVTGSGSMSFSPGFYIITKNLTFNTTGTITADRAVFILTTGGVTIQGGTINMTPPDAGPGSFWANNGVPSWWQGISIFLEKGNSSQVVLTACSSMSIAGAVYAPSSDLIFCGGSSAAPPAQTLVSNTFAFAGNVGMYQGAAAVTPWTPKAALAY